MAEQTISITLNGEKKEVAADQTGVQLFSDDKNIIAVRLRCVNIKMTSRNRTM